MDLIQGIHHIIDGNAVILFGAGASYGAKNAYGDFPSGSDLALSLYKKCNITPDDKHDLQDAAQSFEEMFSSANLITEIRSLLTCASFTKSHETIFSLPWMRYYTTNYDDVALLAARKRGVHLTPVTLSSSIKPNLDAENLCVHINGHIGKLNDETLHHEFKLTAISYLSEANILNSQWGDFLSTDLETAKCVIVLGLSLKYDLDLNKILYNSDLIKKTIIITSPSATENAEAKLKRFGTVLKIGVDGFAHAIEEEQTNYSPQIATPTDRLYSAFAYEYRKKRVTTEPVPEDIFNLFLCGKYSDTLFKRKNGTYCGLIDRAVFANIRNDILSGKRFVFIHADMGNGKTACLHELRYSLSNDNIHIFTLMNADSKKISEEISAIYTLSKSDSVLMIIDDYINYMDILRKCAVRDNGKVQFVLTARSALNYNKMPNILDTFGVKENASAVYDINRLESEELRQCVTMFDRYGLFGRRASLSAEKKCAYLASRKGGACKFQTIMLDVICSKFMQKKVTNLVETIKNTSKQYHSAVLLILLIKIMNLRLSTSDIERISDISLTTDALFKSNPAIRELISFNQTNDFALKAPITARFVLQNVSDPESIIECLYSLALYSKKYSDTPKYSNILTSIVSYSHINSFLRGFNNPEIFLTSYYDKLSGIDYYTNNNFFWLQYAISCIETQKFDRAQRYLNNAYGLIPENFVPFQINNQQARCYLEQIVHDQSEDSAKDFAAAHKLLMIPIISVKDDEINVVRLFRYYYKKKISSVMSDRKNIEVYRSCCKEAYQRTATFLKKYPIFADEFKEMQTRLLSIYVEE